MRPRSGVGGQESGITCLNTPGTVDADYRGEVKVILINLGAEDVTIRRGDRIAQLVVAPVVQARWAEVESLDETLRGAGDQFDCSARRWPEVRGQVETPAAALADAPRRDRGALLAVVIAGLGYWDTHRARTQGGDRTRAPRARRREAEAQKGAARGHGPSC